jgi:hypothetical protein
MEFVPSPVPSFLGWLEVNVNERARTQYGNFSRYPKVLTDTVTVRGRSLATRFVGCVNPSVLAAGGLKRWQPVSMERGPNS